MSGVFVKTLGCKVNTYDTHALENQLREQGFALSESQNAADITVINTCSVTANAEKEARYLARRYKRENPETFVVLTGCYAQTDSANLAKLDDVDFIIPNEVKEQAATLIRDSYAKRGQSDFSKLPSSVAAVRDNRQSHFKSSLTLFDHAESSQTRVFLKIQDGCNGFCTYCLIPYARGASRSVPSYDVVAEVERQIALGVKEIVFTGIHIGDYGRDIEGEEAPSPIVALLRKVLDLPGTWRLRISSLEPSELTEDLLQLLAAHRDRICDHFHLPLQSGSDRILKAMRRTYTRAEYSDAVRMARHYFPYANIGADVIPGFPGETDEDFAETVSLVKELDLNYLHVFPYSKRNNTAAAKMPNHLNPILVKERASVLRQLSRAQRSIYMHAFIGRSMDVLWEDATDQKGRRKGHTANYLSIVGPSSFAPRSGTITAMKINGFIDDEILLATPPNAGDVKIDLALDRALSSYIETSC